MGQNEAIADANASVLAGVLRTNTTLQSLSLSSGAWRTAHMYTGLYVGCMWVHA